FAVETICHANDQTMMTGEVSNHFAGLSVLHFDCFIPSARRDLLAVRAKCDADHIVKSIARRSLDSTARRVAHLDDSILTFYDDLVTVSTKRKSFDSANRSLRQGHSDPTMHVPNRNASIVPG